MTDLVERPRWHSQAEVNEINRQHGEALLKAAEHISRLQKEIETAREDALEEAAATAYRVCAETRHVTLGDTAAAAIRSLKGGRE